MDSRRPQPVGCGGKNDSENRNVILGWHTQQDVPIPSIHDFVAHGNAFDIAAAMATNDIERNGDEGAAS